MKAGWRWYGAADAISLREIRQAGVTDVVAALYNRRPGEVWPREEIRAQADAVRAAGMIWSVVESVPVHEDIKKRTGRWREYVENYKQTLRNLADFDIRTVCYNFMPVLDWTRSNLAFGLADGSDVLRYNHYEVAAFDLFSLKRPNAARDYDEQTRDQARILWEKLPDAERTRIEKAILLGLPGTVDDLTPEQFLEQLAAYRDIGEEALRSHLYDFLNELSPVLEETGVRMAIHPDDPPRPLFGLPRILSNAIDIHRMCRECPSPNVGLTLCTGSLGGSLDNNEVAIFREFAQRVYFCHFRNIRHEAPGVFHESESHLVGKVDMFGLMKELLAEESRRGEGIVVRPDHGRHLEIDRSRKSYSGYDYGGRLVGLAELRGLAYGIEHAMESR
ncbi:MAG: mannonate dehydratase [Kiritimatiellia bacterium]